jgi:acyl carrier protein
VISPDHVAISPDHVVISPDHVVISPDRAVISPARAVIGPDPAVITCYAPAMASYDESLKITCELLRRHVKAARTIRATDNIQTDLGLDSLGVMELVADVETRFGVSIPSEMFDKITTVDDVAKAVTELQR